jgi:predicted transcriptional regulator
MIDTCRISPGDLSRMPEAVSLTDLQLAIVRILWERGASSVVEVQEALAPERSLAQTTVATILTRLEKRGVVRHEPRGGHRPAHRHRLLLRF